VRLERKPQKPMCPGLLTEVTSENTSPRVFIHTMYTIYIVFYFYLSFCMSRVELSVNEFIYMSYGAFIVGIYCCDPYL
jgi:hypothetical protein